jgi:hypothetical protein
MPTSLKVARVFMYVVAGFTALVVVGVLLDEGANPRAIGVAAWLALPGVASLLLAWRMPRGRVWMRRGIIALEIYYILLSITVLADGDPRGIVNLTLPAAILVLVLLPKSSAHFRQQSRGYW